MSEVIQIRECLVCGKLLKRKQKKLCSLSCSATYGNQKATGVNARNYKGGRSINSEGYVRLYMPNHPYACSAGYVYEHRWVMEQHIGRYLKQSEIVHHINGIKDDNRTDNLELLGSQSEHCHYHNELRKVG